MVTEVLKLNPKEGTAGPCSNREPNDDDQNLHHNAPKLRPPCQRYLTLPVLLSLLVQQAEKGGRLVPFS